MSTRTVVSIGLVCLVVFLGPGSVGGETDKDQTASGTAPASTPSLDCHSGCLEIALEVRSPAGESVSLSLLSACRDVVDERLVQMGVPSRLVEIDDEHQRIIVTIPNVDDPDAVERTLSEPGLLEIIDPQGAFLEPGTIVSTTLGGPIEGGTPVPGPVYTTVVSSADVEHAFVVQDEVSGVLVGFKLKDDAADQFYAHTSDHLGLPMSIVLDKRVLSSPAIQAPISDEGIIAGLSPEESRILAIQLNATPLPAVLEVVSSRVVTSATPATPSGTPSR